MIALRSTKRWRGFSTEGKERADDSVTLYSKFGGTHLMWHVTCKRVPKFRIFSLALSND